MSKSNALGQLGGFAKKSLYQAGPLPHKPLFMRPWETLETATAPDGELIELRRRDQEFLIRAGGYDLMSSEDDASSIALSTLGCAHIQNKADAQVLVGGLGMGWTMMAALESTSGGSKVTVAELIPAIKQWNLDHLGHLTKGAIDDPRCEVVIDDVAKVIRDKQKFYDAILLDVDNGPDALAHDDNNFIYRPAGIKDQWRALNNGGVLGVWSFSDDPGYTRRLERQGFQVEVKKVKASKKGRGRFHYIWLAKKNSKK